LIGVLGFATTLMTAIRIKEIIKLYKKLIKNSEKDIHKKQITKPNNNDINKK
jgi:hypothetical protein